MKDVLHEMPPWADGTTRIQVWARSTPTPGLVVTLVAPGEGQVVEGWVVTHCASGRDFGVVFDSINQATRVAMLAGRDGVVDWTVDNPRASETHVAAVRRAVTLADAEDN